MTYLQTHSGSHTPSHPAIDYADLTGLPYTREHDCNWLVAEIFTRFGQWYPKVGTPEDSATWAETFQQAFLTYGQPVVDITPCTIMTFCFTDKHYSPAKLQWHMGVMVTRHKMITTTLKMGVHIINRYPTTPLEGIWWAHFRGAYRIKEQYRQEPPRA